ncbi:MAG: LLM class flavin-dependent oxidoreductase [Proteobacteria bacterium]|nr:LLM class flavin-dependent oxidoreductase [Pseudomonadota bacterium]
MQPPLRFGIFAAPFHSHRQNPTLHFQSDLELIERLDELGYDEAWIGEHHSGGWEMIGSPELFCATAAERTRRIKLCTGVVSLPYHHPLILADRIVQLDHLTRGRIKFGVGPGALANDAHMMGIDHMQMRRMMEESLEALLLLLNSDEPVNMKTDWFELVDARLQHRPYQYPRIPMSVAATSSPSGPRCAGRFGLGLLSMSASSAAGFDALASHREIWKAKAEEHGQTFDPGEWALAAPMYVAQSREEALRDVETGIYEWIDYFMNVLSLPLLPNAEPDPRKWPELMIASGAAVIGTPDDAIEQIRRMQEQTGGFGCYLVLANDWAGQEATHRSYELIARHVFPAFQGSSERETASYRHLRAIREEHLGEIGQAIQREIDRHETEMKSSGRDSGYRMDRDDATPYLREDILKRGKEDPDK